ncbi:hypothetical protein JW756_03615 [Candidatus Woesearchaeota archaeon]|nr:hypothetical protein [Candidatus Woesearchaeota archaeon]
MKVFQSGYNTLYIADSILREEKRHLKSLRGIPQERFISFLIQTAYRRLGIGFDDPENIDKFLGYCRLLKGKNGSFRVGILYAHGSGRWHYQDGIRKKSVQKWIDENDGIHDLLLLHSCNPENFKPRINKSLAVVPTDTIKLWTAHSMENLLVIPNKGAVPFNDEKITMFPRYDQLECLQQYVPSNISR